MDEVELLPAPNLDNLPVSTQANEIHDLIVAHVDSPVPPHEHLPSNVIGPMLYRIKREFLNEATLYSLMANMRHFMRQSKVEPAWAKLWRTRAVACETLSLRLIGTLDSNTDENELLAQSLVYEFWPLADGGEIPLTMPQWLRVSALELAIAAEAKQFLAHPLVVKAIEELWDGHLVLDTHIHKAHRTTSQSLRSLLNNRHGMVTRYGFESTTIIKPSRLRVPKYRHWLKMISVVVLAALYMWNMGSQHLWLELLMSLWALGFVLDEFQVLRAVGSHLYFMTLWSLCDFATAVLFVVFWLLRTTGFTTMAYDVLAAAGITLLPRIFAVLEASESFSQTVISVRKMILALLWCWLAIAMFSVGFWAALAHYGKGVYSRSRVFYDLIQVLFGFTPAVWQSWREYPTWLGSGVLFVYLFISQFVISTIVIATLTARYSETIEHSLEEYHFLRAVKTQVKIKSERQTLLFFCEPLNVVTVALWPLGIVLSPRKALQFQRIVLKLTHLHIFVAIYAYEKISAAILIRNQKQAEDQSRRLQRHVKYRNRRWAPSDLNASARSKFDLVDEALHTPTAVSTSVAAQPAAQALRPSGHGIHMRESHTRSYSAVSASSARSRLSLSQFSDSDDTTPGYVRELYDANVRMEVMLESICSKLGLN